MSKLINLRGWKGESEYMKKLGALNSGSVQTYNLTRFEEAERQEKSGAYPGKSVYDIYRILARRDKADLGGMEI